MRDLLEQLLRTVEVPTRKRVQLRWDEYRDGADSADASVKQQADAAFATLLAWYGNPLFRRIWGFVRSDAAEDVFQTVLRKLHENRRKPRLAQFRAEVLPWLWTIIDNECRSHNRAERQRRNDAKVARPETDPDAEKRRELQLVLADALSHLKSEQKEAIVLHFFEGMDKQDAAAVLEIDRKTFACRLQAGLNRLQQLLPAKVVLAIGAVGVPTALSAKAPTLSAARLGELVTGAWAKAAILAQARALASSSWSFARSALVAGAVVLGGGFALGGWAIFRDAEPEVSRTAPPTVPDKVNPPQPVPVESIENRHRRLFRPIEQQLLTDLQPLAIGGGEPNLRKVEARGASLIVWIAIPQRPEGAEPFDSEIEIAYDPAAPESGAFRVSWQWSPRFPMREIQPGKPFVLFRDEHTGWELTARAQPLEAALQTIRGALRHDASRAK